MWIVLQQFASFRFLVMLFPLIYCSCSENVFFSFVVLLILPPTFTNLIFNEDFSFWSVRLHPVAVSLQRYIAEDIIIQNYHIPAGVCQSYKSSDHVSVFEHWCREWELSSQFGEVLGALLTFSVFVFRLWSSWACMRWAETPKCFSVRSSISLPAGWGQRRTTSGAWASASAPVSV